MCKHMKIGKLFGDSEGTHSYNTKGHISCMSANLIYGVFCKKCEAVVYVGETMQTLYARHQHNLSRIRTGS